MPGAAQAWGLQGGGAQQAVLADLLPRPKAAAQPIPDTGHKRGLRRQADAVPQGLQLLRIQVDQARENFTKAKGAVKQLSEELLD